MKNLFTILVSLLLCSSVFANGRTIDLNGEYVSLGKLGQTRGAAAYETFEVVRTNETPEKVNVSFNMEQLDNVCVRYAYRDVWVPGYRDVVCHVNRYGDRVCRTVYRGGYYRTERYCADYDAVPSRVTKSIRLNFKKAHKLDNGDKEIFRVTFSQNGLFSTKVEASASKVQTVGDYKIKFRKFLVKDQLVFKKK
ncbi:MAG: hypothetical protein GY909_07560 [Oligoflexia bacterium]|nr:hypothetical protein [Oligoflexia bacterium]